MRIKLLILICTGLFSAIFLHGQCPDKDWLWKRLMFLRDSSTSSTAEKLNELLSYESKIKSCSYKFDSTHALLLQRIGATYFYQSKFLDAASYMRQSIKIVNENAGKASVNVKHNIRNYYSLAWIYDSLGNTIEKMKAIDSCIFLAIQFNSADIFYIHALLAKVEHCFDVGDYKGCIDYASKCEKISNQYANVAKSQYLIGLQRALTSLFWRVYALIKFRNYDAAERLLADKIEECKKTGLKRYLGTLYQGFAEVQLKKGNYEKAILNYNQALTYEQEAGENISCKVILTNIGHEIYLKHFKDADKALEYLKKALTYTNREKSEDIDDSFASLSVFNSIANVYVQKGFYDTAFFYFQLALNQVRPGTTETTLLHSPIEEFSKHKRMHYLSDLLLDKADTFKKQFVATKRTDALIQAIKVYKVADQLLDRIKLEQTELESKLLWRSDSRRLYENAIEACYLQGNTADAFYFFEKSRAVLLNDQLNEQRWLGEADILQQSQLKRQIFAKERALDDTNKTAVRYSELEEGIFVDKRELNRLQDQIKAKDPLFYQSFLDSNFISINDAQQRVLKDHQALVELFSGDSAVYVLVITRQNSSLQSINKAAFENLSASYMSYISDPEFLNRNFQAFISLSRQLYRLIFQDISLPRGRIIISPDRRYFPFESLVTNTQPLIYFLEHHAVSYTYSARYLINSFTTNSAIKSYTFMGVAPVKYANGLATLSGSDRSLEKIKNYFHSVRNFIGNKASKNSFLKEYYKYKIIQLYTHAVDSGFTGEPMIYFSDSILSISDLFYENKPSTSLIVLSACETAEGKLYNGEGVFSFNRQFAALGIPSSISNLWQVDNKSSYQLTELFYKYLAREMTPDIALQRAKLEFIKTESKEKSLPYYWASPVLVGKTDLIEFKKPFQWKWIIFIAFFLALASFCGWRRLNREKRFRF